MSDPKLSYIGLSDEDLSYMYTYNAYYLKKNAQYKGIYSERELICIAKYEPFSENTVNVHIYTASRFHKKNHYTKEAHSEFYNYLRDNTGYERILCMVPACCFHVVGAIESFGFKLEGNISRSILWRRTTVDLLMYCMDIIRENK